MGIKQSDALLYCSAQRFEIVTSDTKLNAVENNVLQSIKLNLSSCKKC